MFDSLPHRILIIGSIGTVTFPGYGRFDERPPAHERSNGLSPLRQRFYISHFGDDTATRQSNGSLH